MPVLASLPVWRSRPARDDVRVFVTKLEYRDDTLCLYLEDGKRGLGPCASNLAWAECGGAGNLLTAFDEEDTPDLTPHMRAEGGFDLGIFGTLFEVNDGWLKGTMLVGAGTNALTRRRAATLLLASCHFVRCSWANQVPDPTKDGAYEEVLYRTWAAWYGQPWPPLPFEQPEQQQQQQADSTGSLSPQNVSPGRLLPRDGGLPPQPSLPSSHKGVQRIGQTVSPLAPPPPPHRGAQSTASVPPRTPPVRSGAHQSQEGVPPPPLSPPPPMSEHGSTGIPPPPSTPPPFMSEQESRTYIPPPPPTPPPLTGEQEPLARFPPPPPTGAPPLAGHEDSLRSILASVPWLRGVVSSSG